MINHFLVMCVTSSLLHAVVFKTHMFTHATTKPYTCSLCQAWFTTLGNLKIHMHTNVIFVQRRVIPLVVSTDTETCMINHTCIIWMTNHALENLCEKQLSIVAKTGILRHLFAIAVNKLYPCNVIQLEHMSFVWPFASINEHTCHYKYCSNSTSDVNCRIHSKRCHYRRAS